MAYDEHLEQRIRQILADGVHSDADLKYWVKQGVDFALTLPPK